MSRTSKTLLRLGVPSLAAATMLAGVPLAFVNAASAAPGDTLTLTPTAQTAPVGNCQVFTAAYTQADGAEDNRAVDVILQPRSANQDVAFCTVDDDGDITTGTDARSPIPGGVDASGEVVPGTADREQAEILDEDGDGDVTFGVQALSGQGTVDITAFLEDDDDNDGVRDADEARALGSAQFTAGGDNAVTVVDAEPEAAFNVENGTQDFTVTVRDANGRPVAGVEINYDVTAGPDAGQEGVCTEGTTDNNGQATCSITNTVGQGTDTVRFFVDNTGVTGAEEDTFDTGEANDTVQVTFQEPQAAGTDVVLTNDAPRTNVAGTTGQQPTSDTTTVFSALVTTAAGAPVEGAVVQFLFPNGVEQDDDELTAAQRAETLSPQSARTNAQGIATTTLTNVTPTQDEAFTVTARIITAGGVPEDAASTVVFRDPTAREARTLVLTPESATRTVGDVQALTATARDRFGNPVPGVQVTFEETGTGRFTNGGTTIAALTGDDGQATVELTSQLGETPGSNTVTATITGFDVNGNGVIAGVAEQRGTGTADDECEQPAGRTFGTGTTAAANATVTTAGDCDDTSTVAFIAATPATTAPATTAPAATTTATATPTATTPATQSPTATPTGTTSPTPTTPVTTAPGVQCVNPVGITLNREFIIPGIPVTVTVQAPAGADVQLQAYSRPSTEYRVVRTAQVGASGSISFDVTPGTNTRLFANCVSQTRSASASRVINVRTALSLTVVRNGRRNYTFQGRILPRRADQLITLYRVTSNGTRVLTSQLKTDATGTYRINRRFTGSGTFGFLTRTGQTLTNAAGESTSAQRQQSAEYLSSGRGTARPTAIF